MPGPRLRLLLSLGVVLSAGVSSSAFALPRFPGEVADLLGTGHVPGCKLCHLEAKTTGVTAVTPFVLSLEARGFDGQGTTLAGALARSEADRVDTDGDGTLDVEELRAGTDPNSPFAGASSADDPTYGCALAGAAGGLTPALVTLGAILFLQRRRRLLSSGRGADRSC